MKITCLVIPLICSLGCFIALFTSTDPWDVPYLLGLATLWAVAEKKDGKDA